jgi:hypothetical protein
LRQILIYNRGRGKFTAGGTLINVDISKDETHVSHGQFDVGVIDTESALLLCECLLENSEKKNQNGADKLEAGEGEGD